MNTEFNKYPMRKIRAIFIFTLLVFAILSSLYAERIKCVWTGVERIVAVGDLHGDFGSFIIILREMEIIDDEYHWKGGKTHLVQIGDIFDRGTQAKRILDFLMVLEKEAEVAGGKVHALIGNHEFINIAGIAFDYPGYMYFEQFYSFLPDDYIEETEKKFKEKLGENSSRETNSDPFSDPYLEAEWQKLLKEAKGNINHEARKKYSQNLLEKYGDWLINHNAVIKINDIIFVHAGLNEKYSKRNLEKLNESIRKELKFLASAPKSQFPRNTHAPISYDSNGPLWYRELAHGEEQYLTEEVKKTLDNLKAHHMVMAHTPIVIEDKRQMERFNGKIWIIDTGISRVYRNGRHSALVIESGEFKPWLGKSRQRKPDSLEYMRLTQEGTWISNIANFSFLCQMYRQ